MSTLIIYLVDSKSEKVDKIEIELNNVKKYVNPILISQFIKDLLKEDVIVGIFHSISKYLELPSSSSLFLVKNAERECKYVRLLTGSISLPSNVLGIVFRKGEPTSIIVDRDKVRIGELDCENYRKILIDKDYAYTDIFKISHGLDVDGFILGISSSDKFLIKNSDCEYVRKISLLFKYSPILSKEGLIGRLGFRVLIDKLIGLEFQEDLRCKINDILRDVRVCCEYCDIKCLNACNGYFDFDKLLDLVINYAYDKDLTSRLLEYCDDPFYIVQTLYMYRFNYPEKLGKGFEKSSSILYYSVQFLGICPLSLILFSKSRQFELDIPVQILNYLYKLGFDSATLHKVCELLRLRFRGTIDVKNVLDAVKLVSDVPYVHDVGYVNPGSRLLGRKVQVAIDLVSDIEHIIDIAFTCISTGIDIVEVGTPLLKYYGVKILEALRSNLPEGVIIFADTKTMDVGDLEAREMFLHGADMVSVMAIGSISKVKEAIFEAIRFDKTVLIDLMQCPDPIKTVEDMRDIISETYPWIVICLHRGITEQLRGRGIESDIDLLTNVRKRVPDNVPIAVAGGIRPGIAKKLVENGANIIIVGAALYTSRNIKEAAERLVKEVKG